MSLKLVLFFCSNKKCENGKKIQHFTMEGKEKENYIDVAKIERRNFCTKCGTRNIKRIEGWRISDLK